LKGLNTVTITTYQGKAGLLLLLASALCLQPALSTFTPASPSAPIRIEGKDEPMRIDRRLIALASVLAATALCVLLMVPAAWAGRWITDSCRLPGGQPAATEGWTTSALGGVGAYSGAVNGCAGGGSLSAETSGEAVQGAYEGPVWQFTAPAGATIAGGTISASLTTPHGQAWIATPSSSYTAADLVANCQYNLPCGGGSVWSATFPIDHPGGTNLYAVAVCVATVQGQTQCPVFGGLDAEISISQALIELANSATPSAGPVTGTLLTSGVRGTTELAFQASDHEGPGVYNVTVQIDGKTAYSATPDNNGGACVPAGSQGGVLIFASIQPCRQSESVTIPVNTTAYPDGQHTLKGTVTDAAGNSSVVYDGPVSTTNAPLASAGPALNAPGQLYAATTISTTPGVWSAPSGAGIVTYSYAWQACDSTGANCTTISGAEGTEYKPTPADVGHTIRALVTASDADGATQLATSQSSLVLSTQGSLGAGPGLGSTGPLNTGAPSVPNGAYWSEAALLYLGVPARISSSYPRRAFKLDGRLLNKEGHPILAATLEVAQQVTGSSQSSLIATVKTGETGEFSLSIPAGPSRSITVSYRALSTDTGFAAQAHVHETVRAHVTLTATPHYTSSHGLVQFAGTVAGPLPPGGVWVDLSVHYKGKPQLLTHVQTGSHGHFHVSYKFQGAVGTFPFRAEVIGSQTGFAYATAQSQATYVHTS
jgi:hypothetical protein